ncbi:MAG: 50S ribosomal protein L3 N(5)-glutamine methyltransferase [Burkholderiaceae bacterium]
MARHDPDAADLAEMRTVRDLIRHASSRFHAARLSFGHGTDNAHDEAAALVLWALHLPPATLEPYLDARVSIAERESIGALIAERISSRRPLAYLTGEAWLGGLPFLCDSRALVPRSPIVEAMDNALADWLQTMPPADQNWPATIVDLCTGGGSLAIHAALRFAQARVYALDIDADALALCRSNVRWHGLADRIEMHRGDLLDALPAGTSIDLLLCNPPYVPESSMRELPAEYRAEPGHALAGGPDGMDLIRRLLPQAAKRLSPDGLVVLEVGHEADALETAFPTLDIAWLETSRADRMLALLSADALAAADLV